jgi:hypothetical protein
MTTDPGIVLVCRCPLRTPKLSIERIASVSRRFTLCSGGASGGMRRSGRLGRVFARSICGADGVEWDTRGCGFRRRRLLLDKFRRSVYVVVYSGCANGRNFAA